MLKKLFLVIFILVTAGYVCVNEAGYNFYGLFLKPLIIPALIGFVLFSTQSIRSRYKNLLLTGLLFSWAGDVLLMFEKYNSLFFIFGLIAFLLAHVFYIVLFGRIKMVNNISARPFFILIAVAYYAILMRWLLPHLGALKIPVIVYGAVISIMFLLAMHLFKIAGTYAGKILFFGAAFFVVSDSLLAVNKFYSPFAGAGIYIMSTYALAQLLICKGMILLLSSEEKSPQ